MSEPIVRRCILMSIVFLLGAGAGGAASPPADEPAAAEETEPRAQEPDPSDEEGTPDRGTLREYIEVRDSSLPTSNTIATKLPTPLELTPANVGVVGRALLDERNAIVLGDALPNISGLNVQAGPAVHDFFTVRGFDSLSSVLVLTDGASEPEATFHALYNVEGVEVLKGPGGFLYGRYPLAGTVNVIRKQPLPGDFINIGAQGGSFDTVQGSLDWNEAWSDGDQALRLNGVWRESDNYRDDKECSYAAINPSFSFKAGEKTTLNFNVEYVDAEYSPDSGLPVVSSFPQPGQPDTLYVPDVSRRRSYQSPMDFSDQQVGRFQFDLESRLSDNLRLRNKTYYRGIDWESAGTLFNGTLPRFDLGLPTLFDLDDPQILRTLTLLEDDQDFVGNQIEAILETATGSVTHQLLGGLEVARETDEFRIDVLTPQLSFLDLNGDTFPETPICDPSAPGMPCISVFDPQETFQSSSLQAASLLSAGDGENLILAPYVVDQMKFSEKFQLLAGLRYDTIETEVDFAGTATDIDRTDSELSPMLGAVGALSASFTLYANAGRSHAPPSFRLGGQSDFEPEESTQGEIGAKSRFLEGKLQTTIAAYRIERDNLAITDANGFTQQAGDQRSQGIELELAAEPLAGLRTLFAYAYTDAELTRFSRCQNPSAVPCPVFLQQDLSGNRPPDAPEHLANLWVSQKFTRFGVGGGLRYIGEQFFDADNAFEVDSALVVDAMVSYDLEAWRLQLNLKNLTDEEYETGSFASTSVVPADAFSVYASVQYRFR